MGMHIFSSTGMGSFNRGRRFWNPDTDFDVYKNRSVPVHLDDKDLMVPWAHMTFAQVFVVSPSSFSYVPAVLNMNCVVVPGGWKPISDWVKVTSDASFEGDLKACIARVERELAEK